MRLTEIYYNYNVNTSIFFFRFSNNTEISTHEAKNFFHIQTWLIMWFSMFKIFKLQDTRYFIFQIRAPGGHDTTFVISTYTINKIKYNNYL